MAKNNLTKPASLPQNTPSSNGNSALRQAAHVRLDQLFEWAEREKMYGVLGLEVSFEHGQGTVLRRVLNGTDKPDRY
jgi:hypothetical protein